jgi:ubiquinol-cytochrome c reductase cytochrome c1 subunit
MIKKIICTIALLPSLSFAAGDYHKPKKIDWPFDTRWSELHVGEFDKQSAQRGLQVYKEVCSSCHGLKRIAYRNLEKIGFSEAETKALAAEYEYPTLDDIGETVMRKGLPSDRFRSPYPNEKAARAANNGAYPPDLSLMIKARHDGANYLYSLLTGYYPKPADFELSPGMHYNPYFPGKQIAMSAPLNDGQVTYMDGTEATVEQMAKDVVNFLQFAAEPEMEERKRMGVRVLIFLFLMTIFFYLAKREIWKDVKKK